MIQKKTLILLLFIIWITQSLVAQLIFDDINSKVDSMKLKNMQSALSDDNKSQLPQIISSSPQSQIFEKYVNHKIVEYNGLPDINIPLYEIEIKGLKVPIALSYHGSGIKYLQYDGDVGAGWTIPASGYRISRTVKGRPDEYFDFLKVDEYKKKNTAFERDQALASLSEPFINSSFPCGKYRDGEYDIFTYITPTTSGSFIISDRENFTVTDLNQNLNRIEIVDKNNIKEIKITDSDGNIYIFGTMDDNRKEYLEYDNYLQIGGGKKAITGWALREIITLYNDVIAFSYNQYSMSSGRATYYPMTVSDASFNITGKEYSSYNIAYGEPTITSFSTFYINAIETGKETVKFHRKNGTVYDNNMLNQQLDQIEVSSKLGNFNKIVNFNYEKMPKKIDATKEAFPWHKVLLSVSIGSKIGTVISNNDKYEFDYHEPDENKMYNWEYFYPDQWGYYAHKSDGKKKPSGLLYKSFWLDSQLLEDKIISYPYTQGVISYSKIKDLGTIINDFSKNRSVVDKESIKYFTLKKITFPTGGSSEYFWGPNKFSDIYATKEGGGLRIDSIISKNTISDLNSVKTIFKYGYGENGVGYPSIDDFECHDFVDKHYYLAGKKDPSIAFPDVILLFIRNYSREPIIAELSKFHVMYDRVVTYNIDEKNKKNNGRTESTYEKNKEYLVRIPPTQTILYPKYYSVFTHGSNCGEKETVKYYFGYDPVLKISKFFNTDGKLLKLEEYEYENKSLLEFTNLKSKRMFYKSPRIVDLEDGYLIVYKYFKDIFSSIESIKKTLKKRIVTTYDNSGQNPVTFTYTYDYNGKNQLKSEKQTTSNSNLLIKDYKYPYDLASGNNIYQQMVDKNILSPVIEQSTMNNNIHIGWIKNHYYKDAAKTQNLILPEKVETSTTNSANFRTDLIYNLYDKRGNLRQYTTLDNISTFYLWSYSYQYPIAEIKGATYLEIETAAKSAFGVTSIDVLSQKVSVTEAQLSNFRNHNSLKNALITTYTYQPLVGMLTATDPSGITTRYEYDKFGRLRWIKEDQYNNVSFFEYKFKDQPLPRDPLSLQPLTGYLSGSDVCSINAEQTYRLSVNGGSGDYIYSWIIKDSSGNIIKEENNTNGSITVSFPSLGNRVLSCTVRDKDLAKPLIITKNIQVKQFVEFKNFKNTSLNSYTFKTTADIYTPSATSITFNMRFDTSICGISYNRRIEFKIGKYLYDFYSDINRDIELPLPAGITKVEITISDPDSNCRGGSGKLSIKSIKDPSLSMSTNSSLILTLIK